MQGTDFAKGYLQQNATLDLCVNVLVRLTRISRFRRASQGPQGRVVPFGGARRGPDRRLRTVQSPAARRPGRVPRFVGAYSFIIAPVNRTFVSGCGGSRHRGIA